LAESVLIAFRYLKGKRKKVLVPSTLHPEYLAVLKTVTGPFDLEIESIGPNRQRAKLIRIPCLLKWQMPLAVVVQSPNFYGIVESRAKDIAASARESGAVSVFCCIEPTSLGLFASPGDLGFDIAALELQSLGNPPSFGGPFAGVIAVKKDFMRSIPGRIVGQTSDADGKRAFVLTLATREQHIRREKATSNICSNEGLIALRTAIYLTLMGEDGFARLARTNYRNAHYLSSLCAERGIKVKYSGTFYNEFTAEFPQKHFAIIFTISQKQGYLAGLQAGRKGTAFNGDGTEFKERTWTFFIRS